MQIIYQEEILQIFKIGKSTLYRWRSNPKIGFPLPIRLSARVGYLESEIQAWLDKNRVTTAADFSAPAAACREDAAKSDSFLGNTKGYCSPLSKNNVKNGGGDA